MDRKRVESGRAVFAHGGLAWGSLFAAVGVRFIGPKEGVKAASGRDLYRLFDRRV
jgi:hypothetical protein